MELLPEKPASGRKSEFTSEHRRRTDIRRNSKRSSKSAEVRNGNPRSPLIIVLVRSLGFSQSYSCVTYKEFATQPMLIIEVWTIHETSLGWTRYTPRIYLSFVVMLLMKQCCILL
ncbi:hypothetical protein Hanom_Chr02g00152851 [Helianthus anomalus]